MKNLIAIFAIILMSFGSIAQDLNDALRYSNYHLSGTARSSAMGNAFGSLGGDFASLSINPAGVGVYRSGEFTFTSSFGQVNTTVDYLNNSMSNSEYNIGIDNVGYVATFKTGASSETGLVSLSLGMGFNRLADFTMNSLAEGANSNHSLLTYFTENVNNQVINSDNFDSFYERLAWDTYLINYDEDNNEYFNDITDNGHGQSQRKTVDHEGFINEYLLSLGANFNHKLYLGTTLGFQDVYYRENGTLYEFDAKNNIPYFNNFDFNNYYSVSGGGFSAKFGAIFKPVEQLRLGVAVHLPTFYWFDEVYDNNMNSSITYPDGATEEYFAQPEKEGSYGYDLDTPFRWILSGAYTFGKIGLISVDYEIVDFSSSKLNDGVDGYEFYDQNIDISNAYKTTGILHVGAELRVNPSFSLRGGYENYPSPYNDNFDGASNPNANAKYSTLSGGIGYKFSNFFMDASFKHVMNEDFSKLYPGAITMAKNSMTQNKMILTLGYKF